MSDRAGAVVERRRSADCWNAPLAARIPPLLRKMLLNWSAIGSLLAGSRRGSTGDVKRALVSDSSPGLAGPEKEGPAKLVSSGSETLEAPV